jgi:adenylyl- and sulfurtransferase ThiI
MLYLVRYGEIALKGRNRPQFERKLVDNIGAHAVRQNLTCTVLKISGRLLVESSAPLALQRVFGILSYSPCVRVSGDPETIEAQLLTYLPKVSGKRFRISASRADKTGLSSSEMNRRFGAFILAQTSCTVSLKDFDVELGIEIIEGAAYVFTETIRGFGGLPVGIEGVVGLFVDSQDAVLAGLLLMKRGCEVWVSGSSEVALDVLERFSPHELSFHSAASLEEAETWSLQHGALALGVGTSLPELPPMLTQLPVLCPLIAFTADERRQLLEAFACA